MVLKELAFFGLGALTGGVTSSVIIADKVMSREVELPFSPHKHQYSVEEFEEFGEFEFTYYYDKFSGAFNKVASEHTNALNSMGFKVRKRGIHEYLVRFEHEPEYLNDFAIVHPLFFTRIEALKFLKKCHRYIVAFEVADTTQISKDYADYANDKRLDAIFLPSTFAMETYKRSGVQNNIRLIPHGVNGIFQKPKDEVSTNNPRLMKLREDKRTKILYFALHSVQTRKGGDVVRESLKKLQAKDFVLVVKTFPSPMDFDAEEYFSGIPVIKIADWLSEEDLVYLYDSCDILIHPYRGGAFELNPYEALARGLPTIVTGWGSVLDYANIHNSYLISPKSCSKLFPTTLWGHIGYGVNPDVDHCVELLEFVMGNMEYCKKKARREQKEFSSRTWYSVIDQFLKECRSIWETH